VERLRLLPRPDEVSTTEYLKLGLTVVPVMLLGGALLIWLQL